jgi:hypothetical protein
MSKNQVQNSKIISSWENVLLMGRTEPPGLLLDSKLNEKVLVPKPVFVHIRVLEVRPQIPK